MKLRILFTMTPAFNPNAGGVQRTTFKLGKHFTENGLEVAYYSTANYDHVEVKYGELFSSPLEGGCRNPQNIFDLKTVLEKWRPDIVINQMPYEKELREALNEGKIVLGYILLGCLRNSLFSFKSNARDILSHQLPKPIFQVFDNPVGMAVVQTFHRLKHARNLRDIIDKHDRFILLAPPNRKELNYFVGDYKQEKVISIPNSIPEIYIGRVEKEKVIVHVGRLDIAQKRSDLLLPFWEKVYQELPDWKFVIVGDGPYMNTLKKEIKSKSLPRILLKGYQKPEHYYERASIFMMPSAYEGFPNTILEAQSFGCVPFAFESYEALSWIVNNNLDAILIPPFDYNLMAKRLVLLAQNVSELEGYRKNAIKNASKFTIDKVGEYWFSLFEKLKKA